MGDAFCAACGKRIHEPYHYGDGRFHHVLCLIQNLEKTVTQQEGLIVLLRAELSNAKSKAAVLIDELHSVSDRMRGSAERLHQRTKDVADIARQLGGNGA